LNIKTNLSDILNEKKVLEEKIAAAIKNDNDSDVRVLLESYGV